jgi:hypothetical protein
MRRAVYGHDYKPPGHFVRNLLVGIVLAGIAFTLGWANYDPNDPKTVRFLSGVRSDSGAVQPKAGPQLNDSKRSGSQGNSSLR